MSKSFMPALAGAALICAGSSHAQTTAVETLPEINVSAPIASPFDTPPIKQKYQLPQTAESVTAAEAERRINVVDPEDTLKYLPSLF